ncbi:hypothetical protein QL285_064541 [Trifolium repens]|nr:hypothetical protein QL285_064541 [Trifolium repens]
MENLPENPHQKEKESDSFSLQSFSRSTLSVHKQNLAIPFAIHSCKRRFPFIAIQTYLFLLLSLQTIPLPKILSPHLVNTDMHLSLSKPDLSDPFSAFHGFLFLKSLSKLI